MRAASSPDVEFDLEHGRGDGGIGEGVCSSAPLEGGPNRGTCFRPSPGQEQRFRDVPPERVAVDRIEAELAGPIERFVRGIDCLCATMQQGQCRREIENRPEIVVGLADLKRDIPR